MERLFLKVRPSFLRRLQRAAWLIFRSNSSMSSKRVMSGCCLFFSTMVCMVWLVIFGFLPQFSGSGL